MAQHQLSLKAYTKVLLHCSKYPWQPVQGLLLAPATTATTLADAVPLHHQWLELAPMAEIALQLVDLHCQSNHLRIAGYYYASENPNVGTLPASATALVQVLVARDPTTLVLMLDNSQLGGLDSAIALVPCESNSNGWSPATITSRSATQAVTPATTLTLASQDDPKAMLTRVLQSNLAADLIDFDDHLAQRSGDWMTNEAVNQALESK
ncbi:hypothetical protein H4R34_003127 [Dimargaris verticillata]|uniref:MPN domain-containing protein n=1 Tax=Dimargaris verticillata TaxID=2761393 RepID=A0A9W8B2Q7_9FUNG|nr:hypothetical protein H4R34_003127 [Dimargaris verticillata]